MIFSPTLSVKDTAIAAKKFVKEHMDIFWKIFKPLMLYILLLHLFDAAITYFFFKPDPVTEEGGACVVGGMLSYYFITCLVISWHRVVLHGPDKYIPMNPFKPKKSELIYIAMTIGLITVSFIFSFGIGASANISSFAPVIAIFLFIYLIYSLMKFMFYFASKATGGNITLNQSYKMTDGYILKIILAGLRASLKTMLALILYILICGIWFTGFATLSKIDLESAQLKALVPLIIDLPFALYFEPIFTIIGVTVLSNYYQHALQNKSITEK